MNQGYERFKRKLRTGALIRSILLGVSCGTVVAATFATVQKLRTIAPDMLLCALLGAGVAVVVWLIAYLIMRPSEHKIALKLDNDLTLGEKVQTMLAFQGQEDPMLEMQRADTEERLAATPRRMVCVKHIRRHVIAPVLACVMLTISCVVPVKVEEAPPKEPPEAFEMNDYQRIELMALIQEVKKSEMEEVPKQAVVKELEALLETLSGIETHAEMKTVVIGVITRIHKITSDRNTNVELTLSFEKATVNTVKNYVSPLTHLDGIELRNVFASARKSLTRESVMAALAGEETQASAETTATSPLVTAPANEFLLAAEADDSVSAVTCVADATSLFAEGMEKALKESEVPDTDPLCAALYAFADALNGLGEEMRAHTSDWGQERLDALFKEYTETAVSALHLQYNNKSMTDYAVKRLMEIFGISEDELPPEDVPAKAPDQSEEKWEPEEEDNNDMSSGGIGDGNLLFGSDDAIYDPISESYVVYGEVIHGYAARIDQKLSDGTISEEIEQIINDYFNTLYDGSDKGDE